MRQTNKQIGKGSVKPVKRAEEALHHALEDSKQRQVLFTSEARKEARSNDAGTAQSVEVVL